VLYILPEGIRQDPKIIGFYVGMRKGRTFKKDVPGLRRRIQTRDERKIMGILKRNYQKESLRSSLIPPTSSGDVMQQLGTKEDSLPMFSLLHPDQIGLAISTHYSY
jgi:hypothetical protein